MKAKLDGLNPVVDSVGNKRGSREAPPPDVQDGYHLSLSRTVPVTFDQIDSLVGALHRQLAATLRCGTFLSEAARKLCCSCSEAVLKRRSNSFASWLQHPCAAHLR